MKATAIKLFKDVEEDSEVRIKAYLALVEVPCKEVADVIKETIDDEPVNQGKSVPVTLLSCVIYR